MSPLTVVDLFAGCGGLSLGLELIGFRPILVAELSRSARDTYLVNRTELDSGRVVNDVRDLARMEVRRLRKVANLRVGEYPTLVSGGPPCQGFSGIGHRRTNSDVERHEIASNHLYRDMVKVISKLHPDVFLFENVRGLLSARWTRDKPHKVWDTVRRHFLDHLGEKYAIAYQVVHGYQYGVPQNRPRVLMMGVHRRHWERIGLTRAAVEDLRTSLRCGDARGFDSGLLPQPYDWKGFVPHPSELLDDLVDPSWQERTSPDGKRVCPTYPAAATTNWQRAMRKDAGSVGKGLPISEHQFSNHSERVQQRFLAAQRSKDLQVPKDLRTKKFAQRVLPTRWDAPPHITVASLPDDFIHYESARSLSVREWARLQGFPDWYRFRGPRTTGGHRRAGDVRSGDSVRETPKYTQIGNAVPVPLAAAIGWHIRQLLGIPGNESHGPYWDTPLSKHLRSKLTTCKKDLGDTKRP
ncbi:MAG: DNA cytosine methyltransferase [Sorangiineae bacterium PRO1]|nr:DNA cytosine methyltransferase [Sorangiineae bacterium PRO1]